MRRIVGGSRKHTMVSKSIAPEKRAQLSRMGIELVCRCETEQGGACPHAEVARLLKRSTESREEWQVKHTRGRATMIGTYVTSKNTPRVRDPADISD